MSDERIPWEKCDGIDHTFYNEKGVEVFHETLPAPKLDWAIMSVVNGEETERIIECKTEGEARNFVERYPQSYKLLSRVSAGNWEKVNG